MIKEKNVVQLAVCVPLHVQPKQLQDAEFGRDEFIYGKDKLVETVDARIDITKRQVWS
jgi:hypothetical protein